MNDISFCVPVRTLIAILVVVSVGCGDEYKRTSPINPQVVEAVTLADSVEIFLVDGSHAVNYDNAWTEMPNNGFVELLANSYYATGFLGILDQKTRNTVEKLLLNPGSFSTEGYPCLWTPEYGFRYTYSSGTIVVFICNSCEFIFIKDEKGNSLDSGHLRPSMKKWEKVVSNL